MPRKPSLEPLPVKLRRLRESAGLSQAKLAVKIGVTPGRVGHIEQGVKPPSLETLHALAVALDHDPHDFDPRLVRRE